MQVNITFRGMESTDSLKSHVAARIEHIARSFDKPVEAHAVLSLERYLQHADITIHAGHFVLRGRVKSEDMYKSVDEAVEKIERQLKRYKDKMRSAKLRARDEGFNVKMRRDVIEGPTHEEETAAWANALKVVQSDEFVARPMSVDEAIMQMDLMNSDFLVYTNADSGGINVVYRRKEGNFGIIDAAGIHPPKKAKGKAESRA
jgi:putative sigma-54 modulation protein